MLKDRNEMSNRNRGLSVDASYQVSVQVSGQTVSEGKNLKNQPIRNKNCLLRPGVLMDRDEMSNGYTGPPIDQFYKVYVHLAEQLQRRRILKIGQSETRIACGGHVC